MVQDFPPATFCRPGILAIRIHPTTRIVSVPLAAGQWNSGHSRSQAQRKRLWSFRLVVNQAQPSELVAVTGATGYVGGRLVPELLEAGYRVRCVARSPETLDDRAWRAKVEVVEADLAVPGQVSEAMVGVARAFYLVHSMSASADFEDLEAEMAQVFSEAVDDAGLKQIVYLGGLGVESKPQSRHLTSRHRVGRILASGRTPVTEIRAAVIIGSGSASFEMLRSLVEVLPFMVVPRWVTQTRCQPIAIGDVLHSLVGVLDNESALWRELDLGGPDVVTYREMMDAYAEVAGLRRRVILPVPVLTPSLSSHWVNLVSPLPIRLARSLIDSLTSDVIAGEHTVTDAVELEAEDLRTSIGRAVTRVGDLQIPTRWSSSSAGREAAWPELGDPEWSGGRVLIDERQLDCTAKPERVMEVIRSIGGTNGWFAFNRLWAARGFVDKLVGGVGLRRGRRHPTDLRVGDPVDFFSVVHIHERSLRLLAEMRVPGHAWLEWSVTATKEGSAIRQRALFVPRGVLGRLYWYALLAPHVLIFRGMLSKIAVAAEQD